MTRNTGMKAMMKPGLAIAALAALATAGPAAPADAKGCIKGALLGGVAGHYAGHGVLGAVGGCVVGRRMANDKAARDRAAQQPVPYDGSSSRDSSYRPVPSDPRYSGTNASASGGDSSNLGSLYKGGAYRR